jgi:hypothetical protein
LSRHFSRADTSLPLFNTCQSTFIIRPTLCNVMKLHEYACVTN